MEETVTYILYWFSRAHFREDASITRRGQSRLCPLHRYEFLLGVPVWVHLIRLLSQSNVRSVQAMQSEISIGGTYCHLTSDSCRLCDHKQAHSLHLHAESLQSTLSRGGARDVPYSQGSFILLTVAASRLITILRCSVSAQFHGLHSPVVPSHAPLDSRQAEVKLIGKYFKIFTGMSVSWLFTGSLGIMPKHRHTKLSLTGMLLPCQEKQWFWQVNQGRGTCQEERCDHGTNSHSMDLDQGRYVIFDVHVGTRSMKSIPQECLLL
jgi:hypothetical protein